MPIITVIPVQRKLPNLDYIVPNTLNIRIGDLVIIPLKNKKIIGIVLAYKTSSNILNIRSIIKKIHLNFNISFDMLLFIQKMSEYYCTEMSTVAKLVIPVDIDNPNIKIKQQEITFNKFKLAQLSNEQKIALQKIKLHKIPSLLKGCTSSGKTEVYFHLIAQHLKNKKQVLLLLPEIALSYQIINKFTDRFNIKPTIWNSHVTNYQKKIILKNILLNNIKIVIGTRSSLLLPYSNLGLIIVDEEHDTSYKQEEGVLYNARDMSVLKSSLTKNAIKIVLVSATPSMESIYNTKIDKYSLVLLNNRYNNATFPEIEIVNMNLEKIQKNCLLSSRLIKSMHNTLLKSEQILLFLNRKGYSPMLICIKCNYRILCKSCSTLMVVYKEQNCMICHHCGYQNILHKDCPKCNSDQLLYLGYGIERIKEEVIYYFPKASIHMISKDQIKSIEDVKILLQKIENNEINILIGTQLITKGYHFPNLTLIGVLDADFNNSLLDMRSSEKTFQLLEQVRGRAGRAVHKPGTIIIQTYNPDGYILKALKSYPEEEFTDKELENRKFAEMPPFSRTASIILSSKNKPKVLALSKILVNKMYKHESVKVLGPMQSILFKIANKYRYRILIISKKNFKLSQYIKSCLQDFTLPKICSIKIDIDPQNFS